MFYESIILYVVNKPWFMNPLYYEKIIEQVILPGLNSGVFVFENYPPLPSHGMPGGGAIFEVPGGKNEKFDSSE